MVNGTASVTSNFQFTMVNLTLVSCPDNSSKNKVDLTPDNNLVTKKKEVGTSLVYLNHAYFVDSLSNAVITVHYFADSYFINMKFIFLLIREHGF